MDTKQLKIKEAYGEYSEIALELCDENGWIKNFDYYTYFPQDNESKRIGNYDCKRPKSLEGIENNNGWIKIESEEDLPNYDVWLYSSTGTHISRFFTQDGFPINRLCTHYQTIEKPEPPIY